jgi:hypothetical protein
MKSVRRTVVISVAVGILLAVGVIGRPVSASAAVKSAAHPNLIRNPGAESAAGSPTGGVVPVPDWTETTGTGFTAVKYGASGGGFPTLMSPGPSKRGANFFAGGPDSDNDVAVQTISLSSYLSAIKAGKASFALSGWIGGSGSKHDSGFVELDFKNQAGNLIGTSETIGPVTATERDNTTGLLHEATSGAVPKAARTAYLQLSLFSATEGAAYNYGFADDLKLVIKTS